MPVADVWDGPNRPPLLGLHSKEGNLNDIRVEPLFSSLPVRKYPRKDSVEIWTVIVITEMAKLMDNDVINARNRGPNEIDI